MNELFIRKEITFFTYLVYPYLQTMQAKKHDIINIFDIV
jgi:hypothetical protein